MVKTAVIEEHKAAIHKTKGGEQTKTPTHAVPLVALQNHVGNAAVQRLLAQRAGGDGAFDLDDATAGRINSARGGGQALDTSVQTKLGESMGADFSGVRVHTGSESHQLNEQLNAKAFTTGSDIFFREGTYSPQSSGGQELIAHELTHVVQQSSGVVGNGGSSMTVNAPGDRFEQEADSVAKSVTSSASTPTVQRQELDPDDLPLPGTAPEEEMPTTMPDAEELKPDEEKV